MDDQPTISISLPLPPSTNALWHQPPGLKRRIRTPRYSKWLVEAGWEAQRQLVGVTAIAGAFNARITVPVTSHRDRDNWSKPLCDLLTYVQAINDDAGLRDYSVIGGDRSDCLIELWDLGGPPVRRRSVTRAHGYSGKTPAAKIRQMHASGYWRPR